MNRLPVLEKTYDLLRWLVPAVAEFPRQHRYLIGERIESAGLDLLDLLVEAQASPETRRDALRRASIRVDRMQWLLRLARDLNLVGARHYEHGSRLLADVGKQVGGWLTRGRHAVRPQPAGPEAIPIPVDARLPMGTQGRP